MVLIKQISAAETYPLRHSVMWPDQPLSFIKLPEDVTGIHFGLFKDELLISVVSLFISGETAQFRKFATVSEEQQKGYGTWLLNHLIDFVKEKKLQLLWCNARVDKTTYYLKFGFNKTTKTYIKKGINFVILEKKFKV